MIFSGLHLGSCYQRKNNNFLKNPIAIENNSEMTTFTTFFSRPNSRQLTR